MPLDRWLADGDQTHIRWSARVVGTELSSHQRLRARIAIEVDGNDLVKRKGKGYLIMAVQLNDSQNRPYQIRKAIDLSKIDDDAGKINLIYTQDALVTPDSYRVTLGILDSATGEHSVLQRMLNVSPLKNDPLPLAWRDLPPVELLQDLDAPDNLFLPYAAGRLNLPLATHHEVRVELVINGSPSPSAPTAFGPSSGPRTPQISTRTRSDLIPALKVLSQIDPANGVLNVSMLDITRRQVVFEQKGVRDLDWPTLRKAFVAADPNVIDVHSLEKRGQNAQFFVEQVAERIAEDPARPALPALIVLSGPMSLISGEDLHPIKASSKPAGGIYYIRYHSVSPRSLSTPLEEPRRRTRGFSPVPTLPVSTEPLDSLEKTLKPLQPQVFDVYTPEQFRKALATVISEISRL